MIAAHIRQIKLDAEALVVAHEGDSEMSPKEVWRLAARIEDHAERAESQLNDVVVTLRSIISAGMGEVER